MTDTIPRDQFAGLVRAFVNATGNDETRRAYERALRQFAAFNGGDIWPATVATVQAWRQYLSERSTAGTVAQKLAILRAGYDYLLAEQAIPFNPAHVRLVRPPRFERGTAGRALTPAQVNDLLLGPNRGTERGCRDYALLLMLFTTSRRCSEIVNLRRRDLEWQGTGYLFRYRAKGGKIKTQALPPPVARALDAYFRLADRPLLSSPRPDPTEAVFQSLASNRAYPAPPLSSRAAEQIVRRYGQLAGLGRVTSHDARRSVVTELLRRGASEAEIMAVTGHESAAAIRLYDRRQAAEQGTGWLNWE